MKKATTLLTATVLMASIGATALAGGLPSMPPGTLSKLI
jgi:hypothetical protein